MAKKRVLITGGNGFIGHHLARSLKSDGYYVVVVDIKEYEYGDASEFCDENLIWDLRNNEIYKFLQIPDLIFSLAADMGGCQFVFTGENDADIMHNSALINLNLLEWLAKIKYKGRVFYSSSACLYPEYLQNTATDRGLKESDAYPAAPDSEYGWEKLFSERLYLAYARNYNIDVRIGRYHNVYGPEGVYKGGREKAPASICRKVAEAVIGGHEYVEMWGDGNQKRSFLYIDDCISATKRLMESDYKLPLNIGSSECISIKILWDIAIQLSGKNNLELKSIDRPAKTLGVMGRNSDNTLAKEILNWEPDFKLHHGMDLTMNWIREELRGERRRGFV